MSTTTIAESDLQARALRAARRALGPSASDEECMVEIAARYLDTNPATVWTLEEACATPGVSVRGMRAEIRFDSMPNWYHCFLGFACPRCMEPISWHWEGDLPGMTTPGSIGAAGVHPVVDRGELLDWGHRYIVVRCPNRDCSQEWFAHNFD